MWSWGDNSPNTSVRGYTANHIQSHAYYSPGSYTILVTAKEADESLSIKKSVIVLGNYVHT